MFKSFQNFNIKKIGIYRDKLDIYITKYIFSFYGDHCLNIAYIKNFYYNTFRCLGNSLIIAKKEKNIGANVGILSRKKAS